MVTGYTSQPYLHIPEYGLRRLIEQLELLDKEESLFDEHIVKLIEEGPFSILGDLNLRSDLKKLLEIRAAIVILPLGGLSLGDYDATGVLGPLPGMGRSFNMNLTAAF